MIETCGLTFALDCLKITRLKKTSQVFINYNIYIVSEKDKKHEPKADDEYRKEEYDFQECFQDLGEHHHVNSKNIEPKIS
jgi:hypothetical protein